jgi:hypothetical protein
MNLIVGRDVVEKPRSDGVFLLDFVKEEEALTFCFGDYEK